MDKIDSIKLDGSMDRDCPGDSVLARALAGELVIVRQCLQKLEVFEQIRDLLIESVKKACGTEAADQVRANGIERIHEFVEVGKIEEIYSKTRSQLARKMPAITAEMYRRFGAKDPFYVHDASLVRLMMPYGLMKSKQQEFKKHLGKLTLHGPHHDHYQNVPVNALNAWIAIGKVQHANGMFIYPEVWGMNLPQGKDAVREDQYLGHPISLEMDPGDALIFHSHHMHGSRLNTTEETRVVLTNRVCLETPQYPDPSRPQKYYPSATFPSDVDYSTIFSREGFVGQKDKYLKHGLKRLVYRTAGKLGLDFRNIPEETPNEKNVTLSSIEEAFSELAEGEIAAVDKKTCVTRIAGEVVSFRRHCPHEGADLSLGFVEDGRIVCPYHGLRFCPKSGEANCSAVTPLKTEILQPVGG